MYDTRIQYAMDNFIDDKYFLPMKNVYDLKEAADSGKSLLTLKVEGENICVEEYDNKKRCNFLKENKAFGMHRCIDHFVLKKQENSWDLYMIEMKSSVSDKKWFEIKLKMRSSLLNIKALCEFLCITIDKVYTYTTYERECFETPLNTADIKTKVPLFGERATKFKEDEWDKSLIKIKIDEVLSLPHVAVKMERNSDGVLVGNLNI